MFFVLFQSFRSSVRRKMVATSFQLRCSRAAACRMCRMAVVLIIIIPNKYTEIGIKYRQALPGVNVMSGPVCVVLSNASPRGAAPTGRPERVHTMAFLGL